jgi:hypothetical protein
MQTEVRGSPWRKQLGGIVSVEGVEWGGGGFKRPELRTEKKRRMWRYHNGPRYSDGLRKGEGRQRTNTPLTSPMGTHIHPHKKVPEEKRKHIRTAEAGGAGRNVCSPSPASTRRATGARHVGHLPRSNTTRSAQPAQHVAWPHGMNRLLRGSLMHTEQSRRAGTGGAGAAPPSTGKTAGSGACMPSASESSRARAPSMASRFAGSGSAQCSPISTMRRWMSGAAHTTFDTVLRVPGTHAAAKLRACMHRTKGGAFGHQSVSALSPASRAGRKTSAMYLRRLGSVGVGQRGRTG